MTADLLDQPPDEVDALVATYLDALDHGRAPPRAAWLAEHPAVADELARFLDDLEGLAPPAAVAPTGPDAQADTLVYAPGQGTDDAALAEAFPPGRTFGDYELLAPVARGGMGVVFKARHAQLDRVVALKMILAGQLASPADIQRFRTEAQAAARLHHPGIVPVYEVGECQGLHYFTMAFVDGTSLADRLRAGPLDPHEAARLVRDLTAALQFAHDNGVVHRDLKPGNVLIDRAGQPRLTDFGLAKRTDRPGDLTGTGHVVGTPSYMAPEQAGGAGSAVGPAADVYGLGALLFALLTGRPPFQAATSLDTVLHVLSADPPKPTALNPAVPRDLETVCLKCLEKPADKRYASAAALGDDLDRFLTGRPILARPVGAVEKAYRWFRRRPAVGAMAVALVALLVAVPLLLAGLLAEEVAARQKVQAAEQARTEQLFYALVNGAAARRTSPRVGRGFRALEIIKSARAIADELRLPDDAYTRLRSETASTLSQVDLTAAPVGPGWVVRRGPELCRFVRAADLYLAWDPPGGVLVRRAADRRVVHRIAAGGAGPTGGTAQLSADNRFAYTHAGDKLAVWRVDGTEPRECLRRAGVTFAAFVPDRAAIAVCTAAGDLVLQPLGDDGGDATTVGIKQVVGEPFMNNYWKCSPGRNGLVAVAVDRGFRVVDTASGRASPKVSLKYQVEHMAWSPDGRELAVTHGNFGVVVVYDPATGGQRVLRGSIGGPSLVGFSPTGRFLLVSNGWNSRGVLLDMATGETDLRFHTGELDGAARDGQEPVWWRPASEDVYRTLAQAPGDGIGLGIDCAVHPGGRLLVATRARGAALFDVATGRRVGTLPAPGGCLYPRFDAAGNLFALVGNTAVRWPVTATGGRLRFGPMESLSATAVMRIDVSPDGRHVATMAYGHRPAVLDRQTGAVTTFPQQPDARGVAISPDGSLVAAFGWEKQEFRLWRTDDPRTPIQVCTTDRLGVGRFTPDGKYLVTVSSAKPVQLWSIPDCRPVRDFGVNGAFAVSPDGRYVAVAEMNGKVHILRINDGSLIAQASAPGEEYMVTPAFSPDGRYLIGTNANRVHYHVWDLWQLRRRLAEMKLDYEPDPAPEPVEPRESITVEIAKQ